MIVLKLSDSIRDLLLINPKNIEVRTKISERLKKTKAKILEQTTRNKQLGLTEFDEDYVEPKTDRSIHALIVDLNKYFRSPFPKRKHNDLIDLKSRFTDSIIYNSSDYQLNFHYSRVLKALKDKSGELNILEQAEKLNPKSPRICLAIAMHHFYNNDYEKAECVFKSLIAKKYNSPEKSSRKFSYTITKLYLLCLLYLGKYDEIIKITENWKEEPNWVVMYGTYRASTLKRQTELKKYTPKEIEPILKPTFSIYLKRYLKLKIIR